MIDPDPDPDPEQPLSETDGDDADEMPPLGSITFVTP